MIGINASGAEYSWEGFPENPDFVFLRSAGISLVRLPISWERLQPELSGKFDTDYLGELLTCIDAADQQGIKLIVDVHNYGRYNHDWGKLAAANWGIIAPGGGDVIGSEMVPVSAFASFWRQLATELKDKSAVTYLGLMNEPHTMGDPNAWAGAAQAAVDAIREVDTAKNILVSGTQWGSAQWWPYDNGNLKIHDSASKLLYEAHLYFDRAGAGVYEGYDADGAYPDVGVDRVAPFLKWLADNDANGFIGEFGVPGDDPRWLTVLERFVEAITNAGVSGTYWNYMYTTDRTPSWWNPTDKMVVRSVDDVGGPQLSVLQHFLEQSSGSAPTSLVLSNAAVKENSKAGTTVGTLSSIDPDAGDIVSYSLVDDAGGRFALVGDRLQVNGVLDYEAAKSHEVTIMVTDKGGLSLTRAFSVGVEDVNEVPTGLVLSNAAVKENSKAGITVGTLSSIDPDAGDVVSYSLVDDAGGRFALVGDRLQVNGVLDYEAAKSHEVTIMVTDKGGLSLTRAFSVGVEDVNEVPTGLVLSNAAVKENSKAGIIVGTLSSIDPDAGDVVSYSLVDDAGGRFALVGDRLQVNGVLDYEAAKSHEVTIMVTDKGGLSLTRAFSVGVEDVNEVPTGLVLSNAAVKENSKAGIIVGTLSSIDPDAGDVVSYSLVDDAGGRFALVGDRLQVNGVLDYEAAKSHEVTIMVTDKGGLSLTRAFSVGVEDVNEVPTVSTSDNDLPISPALTSSGSAGSASSHEVSIPFGPLVERSVFGTVATDTTSHGGQVYALYQGLLGRDSDALGLEHWTATLDDGSSLDQLAQALLGSAEGQGRAGAADNATFVTQLYRTTLHRDPEAAGLKDWTDQLDHGATRSSVGIGFALSSEHVESLQSSLGRGVFVPDEDTAIAARVYYAVLGRSPDEGGLMFWRDSLKSGASATVMTASMLNAPEVVQKTGSLTNAQYVDQIYYNALGRHAEAEGLNAWTHAIDSHTASRADVTTMIGQSVEAQLHLAPLIEHGWVLQG